MAAEDGEAGRRDRGRDPPRPHVVLLLGGTTLTIALLIDNIMNGAARPLFGWISDNIGRENTLASGG